MIRSRLRVIVDKVTLKSVLDVGMVNVAIFNCFHWPINETIKTRFFNLQSRLQENPASHCVKKVPKDVGY